MNITVINGTEKHGVTHRLKEIFLAEFKDRADITAFACRFDRHDLTCICVSCHGCNEGIARPFCLSLDAAPACF